MKSLKICLLGLIFLIPHTATLKAQSAGTNLYSTDFYTDSTGYTYSDYATLNGQGGWYNNGLNNTPGSGTVMGNASGWANGMGGTQANAFVLGGNYGGILPSDQNTYPSSYPTQLNQGGGGMQTLPNSIFIHTVFALYGSTAGTPNDDFGIAVVNTTGYTLMDINFQYAGRTSNGLSTYNIGATSYANDSSTTFTQLYNTTDRAGQPVTPLQSGIVYNLGFQINAIGTTNQFVSLWSYQPAGGYTGVPFLVGTTAIAGTDFSPSIFNDGNTNIGSIAPSWYLYDGATVLGTNGNQIATNYGNNAIIFSSVAVALPEPKAWILFGLSGLAIVVYLRKRDA